MWLQHHISPLIHTSYAISEKTLEIKSEHLLEIFRSKQFGDIALIDEKHILCSDSSVIIGEFLAHVGACCLPTQAYNAHDKASSQPHSNATASSIVSSPYHALVLGGFNLEVAFGLIAHNIHIHYLQSDVNTLDALAHIFPHYNDVRTHECFTLYQQTLDLPLQKYHLIIHQGTPNTHELDGLRRILQHEGICIIKIPHPYLQQESYTQTLRDIGAPFAIAMPFTMPFAMPFCNDEYYLFLSHTIHPLANLWLQQTDLLETTYYNADIHHAAFALPSHLASSPWIKS